MQSRVASANTSSRNAGVQNQWLGSRSFHSQAMIFLYKHWLHRYSVHLDALILIRRPTAAAAFPQAFARPLWYAACSVALAANPDPSDCCVSREPASVARSKKSCWQPCRSLNVGWISVLFVHCDRQTEPSATAGRDLTHLSLRFSLGEWKR